MSVKRKSAGIVGICILIIICIISLSAGAALRTSVFFYSPQSAFSIEYRKVKTIGENQTLYRITANPPMEKATQQELYTWMIYSFGPFHFAKYYGEE